MAGFIPAIHVFLLLYRKDVDGRDKPGHDEVRVRCSAYNSVPLKISSATLK